MKNEKKALIFNGKEAEDFGAVEKMTNQIRDLGGNASLYHSKRR